MLAVLAQSFDVQGPFVVPVAAIVLTALVGIVALVAVQIRIVTMHRLDLEAKQEMLDRGMSADEIERVIEAGKDR